MARSDRLFRLLHLLRSLTPPVTAARLAAETEVSERSVYRDIAALRAAGARIEGEAGYGYALTEDPALPPQSFARIEIEALLLGLSEARFSGDAQIAAAADTALAKIIATLPERQQREAAHAAQYVSRNQARSVALHDVAPLRAACWDETALDMSYCDKDGLVTERRVFPLIIAYLDNVLVLLAWCCLREDYRQFRIDRIIEATPAGESFRPRRVAMINDYVTRMAADRSGP